MNGETLQTMIVLAIVLGAAAYLVTRWRRTLAMARTPKDGGCAGGCDCSSDH
jgi:hypothetical protein